MEDIILFGAVNNIKNIFDILKKINTFNVVEIWDNYYEGTINCYGKDMAVSRPYKTEKNIPILIIPSQYENEIRNQLIQLGIPQENVKSWWYCFHYIKDDIVKKYAGSHNPHIRDIVEYLKKNELHVYNGGLFEKYQYRADEFEVFLDEDCGLYYSYWKNRKLYMKRGMEPKTIKNYLNSLRLEQDKDSPHCYEQICEIGRQNDVIVDAGAAEGFFSLERIDTAQHIYLIECDEGWLEALKHTFAPYEDKVSIINSYIGEHDSDECITLDKIDSLRHPVNVIKMDIEGAEEDALRGGDKLFSENRNIDIIACSYHKSDAYSNITTILVKDQFELRVSNGYIFFPYGDEIAPELRHGLIIAQKKKVYRAYIWGIGKYYSELRKSIRSNCRVVGLLDSNSNEKNRISGEEIMNPEILAKVEFDYVLVSVVNSKDIIAAYRNLGLPEEKIIVLWDITDETNDFIDTDVIKYIKQHYDLEKAKIRLNNAPYEFSNIQTPKMIDAVTLLNEIYEGRKSLARFGDGEFEIMRLKERPWFQKCSSKLAARLREVINSNVPDLCLAVADDFGNLDKYTESAADGIRAYIAQNNTRHDVLKLFPENKMYYDAYVSRPYIIYKDKSYAKRLFKLWKKIWFDRDVLLVEGKTSCMGKGNDLLSDTRSVKRILCPEKNAFEKYDDILNQILKFAQKSDLILVKLGPTATVLAHDLSVQGYQAIDVGQLDNEYDWYLMGVDERVEIEGKTVAETLMGRKPRILNDLTFENEVLCHIP